VVGYDFFNEDSDPMDDNEHGTHVSGTIAAVGNNGIGVIGVCPNAKIMPLKFLDNTGSGFTSDAVRAIDFGIANGARVFNASWGGGPRSQALADAIQRARAAGILFVTAAGNDSLNNDTNPDYPSGYEKESDNVITVAASTPADGLASFSNFGVSTVDLAAPGVSILSTVPGNRYAYFDGTSMATPHVSAVAALVWSYFPTCSGSQIRTSLNNSALDLGTAGRDVHFGYGLVQAKAAYDRIKSLGCGK